MGEEVGSLKREREQEREATIRGKERRGAAGKGVAGQSSLHRCYFSLLVLSELLPASLPEKRKIMR